MSNPISILYDYNVWANDRVLQHLESLPEEVFSNEVDLVSEDIGYCDVFEYEIPIEESLDSIDEDRD